MRLPNGKLTEGKLWNYDLYYNIAVVKIKYFPELSTAQIHNQGQSNVKLSQSKLVAVGRGYESGELMATGGTLLYKPSKLDCKELMTSTCKITKVLPLIYLVLWIDYDCGWFILLICILFTLNRLLKKDHMERH